MALRRPPPSLPPSLLRRCNVPARAPARPPPPAPARKPLNRRFIVVEGIYANYGDVAPLDAIRALKEVGAPPFWKRLID